MPKLKTQKYLLFKFWFTPFGNLFENSEFKGRKSERSKNDATAGGSTAIHDGTSLVSWLSTEPDKKSAQLLNKTSQIVRAKKAEWLWIEFVVLFISKVLNQPKQQLNKAAYETASNTWFSTEVPQPCLTFCGCTSALARSLRV